MPGNTDTMFEHCRPRLQAIARRMLGSAAEADDLVQDCFLKWHATPKEGMRAPAAWLTTVLRHLAIDRLRQRQRESTGVDETAVAVPTPEELLLQANEVAEALTLLLRKLSAQERQALVLRDVFECDHADIASTLGLSANHSRQLLFRARRRVLEDEEKKQEEKLSRARIAQFQAALHQLDRQAVLELLGEPQGRAAAMCAQYRQIRRHIMRMTALDRLSEALVAV